jgi:ectoine hydroxylase-related dioxygenase (phytanoyl-CoA dioxygenase family)
MRSQLLERLGRRALTADQRSFWDANGFLVLPEFFSERRMDDMNALVDAEWSQRARHDNPLVIDVLEGPMANQRAYFRDVPDEAREYPYKLNDLYLTHEEVRALALDRRLVRVLTEILGGAPAICNSLHFERGSQQAYHFDTYYMPGPGVGGLVVSSICLEDVDADAGPVTYYPGCHKIPPYRFSHGGVHAVPSEMEDATEYAMGEVEVRDLRPEAFLGRKGDVLLWHEQLYHGGSPIVDQAKTRRSLVTHYWTRDLVELDPGWSVQPAGKHAAYFARPHQPVV